MNSYKVCPNQLNRLNRTDQVSLIAQVFSKLSDV